MIRNYLLLSNFNFHQTICFRIDQTATINLAFGDFGEFSNFGKKFKPFSKNHFSFFLNMCFSRILTNNLFTKIVLEFLKMNLDTNFVPFWNGTSVINLLISSNLCFSGLMLHSHAKHLCSFLDQTLLLNPSHPYLKLVVIFQPIRDLKFGSRVSVLSVSSKTANKWLIWKNCHYFMQ